MKKIPKLGDALKARWRRNVYRARSTDILNKSSHAIGKREQMVWAKDYGILLRK